MFDSPIAAVLLLAAIAAMPLAMKRYRRHAPAGIRVITRAALSRNAAVAVIAIEGRRWLVGTGEHGVQLLTELDSSDSATSLTNQHHRSVGMDANGAPAAVTDIAVDVVLPRIGPLDRLRQLTVRTHHWGRPARVTQRR